MTRIGVCTTLTWTNDKHTADAWRQKDWLGWAATALKHAMQKADCGGALSLSGQQQIIS